MLKFKNFTKAWEGVNELLIDTPQETLELYSGIRLRSATYLYNITLEVAKSKLYDKFDFGRYFNYTMNKWKSLVANYIDMVELKGLKESIKPSLQSNKPFSVHYQFKNKHTNGKGCLISFVAHRTYNKELCLNVHLRSSEVTKRLAVDFLLIQRIGEFLYDGQSFKSVIHITQMFNDDNVLLMYHAYKPLKAILKQAKAEYCKELSTKLSKMLGGNPSDYKYKVHLRAFKVLRPDLYEYPTTLAKDCILPHCD